MMGVTVTVTGAQVGGVTAEQAVRGALRLLASAQQLRRAGIEWNLHSHPRVLDVPDLAPRRGWPRTCAARKVVDCRHPWHFFPRVFVCSRRPGHTGRHAAGQAGRVTAVWAGAR